MRRAFVPSAAALLGLSASLAATAYLYRAGEGALERVLAERLRGAGETAAELLRGGDPAAPALRSLMRANGLEGAYLLAPDLVVIADATGPSGGRADLLRVDVARAREALAGRPSVGFAYTFGSVPIATGYFPIRGPGGGVRAVLGLEAGQEFTRARSALVRAAWIGVGVSVAGALSLAAVAWSWFRAEARRRREAQRAALGDAMARMGAMVAHEIRSPLWVIRAAVELVRARSGRSLAGEDREALADVLGEVERLRGLAQDFLDLSREPPISPVRVDLAEVAGEAARALAAGHPSTAVTVGLPPLPVDADPARLRQVFGNLLLNAAQAGARRVEVRGGPVDGVACVEVRDDGPGVGPSVRARLFEPFATGRPEGTGLGLAVSRRIVERHGGALRLLDGPGGASFEIRLPLAAE